MRDYEVTYSAIWADRAGTVWSTGTQKKIIQAESRAAAVTLIRSCWPEGAGGECSAKPVDHSLLERARYNVSHGQPASFIDETFPADLADAEVLYYPI